MEPVEMETGSNVADASAKVEIRRGKKERKKDGYNTREKRATRSMH